MLQTFDGQYPEVKISSRWLKFYQTFCTTGQQYLKKEDKEGYPLFQKYTNLYTLCAAIGHMAGQRKPLQEDKYPLFSIQYLEEKSEWPLLVSIAWNSSNKDLNIIMNSREIIKICDEYAEAGVEILAQNYPFDHIFIDNCLQNSDKIDVEFLAGSLIKSLENDFMESLV